MHRRGLFTVAEKDTTVLKEDMEDGRESDGALQVHDVDSRENAVADQKPCLFRHCFLNRNM